MQQYQRATQSHKEYNEKGWFLCSLPKLSTSHHKSFNVRKLVLRPHLRDSHTQKIDVVASFHGRLSIPRVPMDVPRELVRVSREIVCYQTCQVVFSFWYYGDLRGPKGHVRYFNSQQALRKFGDQDDSKLF